MVGPATLRSSEARKRVGTLLRSRLIPASVQLVLSSQCHRTGQRGKWCYSSNSWLTGCQIQYSAALHSSISFKEHNFWHERYQYSTPMPTLNEGFSRRGADHCPPNQLDKPKIPIGNPAPLWRRIKGRRRNINSAFDTFLYISSSVFPLQSSNVTDSLFYIAKKWKMLSSHHLWHVPDPMKLNCNSLHSAGSWTKDEVHAERASSPTIF